MTDDELFSKRAYREARKRQALVPYQEGDGIEFGSIFYPVKISDDFEQQVHYWTMRRDGQSHRLAEMLATRSFPATKGTDRAFMQGRKLDGSQFEGQPDIVRRQYMEKARAAGVNPTGKYYSGSLAAFPGDPRAWVDSLHDVKAICEERGWECDGAVKVEAPRYGAEEPGPYRVADDIVDDHVSQVLSQRPELTGKAAEVREEVQGRLSGVHG